MTIFIGEDKVVSNDTVTTRMTITADADGQDLGTIQVHSIPVQYIEEINYTYRGRSWVHFLWESTNEPITSVSLGTGKIKFNNKNVVKAPTESGKDNIILFFRTVNNRDILSLSVTSKI